MSFSNEYDNHSSPFRDQIIAETEYLVECFLEGTLAQSEANELLRQLDECPVLRQYLFERLEIDQLLRSSYGTALTDQDLAKSMKNEPSKSIVPGSRRGMTFRIGKRHLTASAVLMILACSIAIVTCAVAVRWAKTNRLATAGRGNPVMSTFGTISLQEGCVWGDATPLGDGEQISREYIHLVKGIAQIRFNNGVRLTLEAPIRLSLIDQTRCYLYEGTMFAQVSPDGIGFTVETTTAAIKDLGTEFGVSVSDGNVAEVQVFSGLVEVHHADQNDTIPITTGRRLRLGTSGTMPYNPNRDIEKSRPHPEKGGFVCTTKEGRGKEGIIVSGGEHQNASADLIRESECFILVKNAGPSNPLWHRKGYFSIDFSSASGRIFDDVQLELSFAPTGVGFTSRSAELSIFTVYGLIDDSKDGWDENSLNWSNAPGNGDDATSVASDHVVKIGQFEIAKNEHTGIKVISGESLRHFLAMDGNGLATFIIVCETPEPRRMGPAFGFANRHHPDLPPPTLRFFVEDER